MRQLRRREAAMLTYKRLHFDDQGIKKGSGNDYLMRWDDVISVSTVIFNSRNGRYYKSEIETRAKKSISFECRKDLFSFSKLPGYGEALGFIAGRVAPPFVCEKTKFVAKWGKDIGSVKKLRSATKGQIPNLEDLKSLGNLYLVRFNFWRARTTFRKILEFNPNDTDALEGLALVEMDLEKGPSKIIPQYEHLVTLSPNHVGYLRRLTTLMLDKDDPQGENYAARLVGLNPGEVQGRLSLGFYNFRRGMFSEAKAIFRTVETIANDHRVKEYVREQIGYIERYETNPGFRKKEEVKRIGRTVMGVILTYIVPAIVVLLFLFRIAQKIFKF
jgi:tetratricopeptide (TPR) repeat protein